MALGIPDELYWRITPVETGALLDELIERECEAERARNHRAAFLAAETYNATGRYVRRFKPSDFMSSMGAGEQKLLPPEALAGALDALARTQNRRVAKKP